MNQNKAQRSKPKFFKKFSFRKNKSQSSLTSHGSKLLNTSLSNGKEDDNNNNNKNETAVNVRGSVRRNNCIDDSKLLNELDFKFYDISFDSISFVMNALPLELHLEYIESQSIYYKEHCDAVQRTFKKKLLDNSHSFVLGMQQIQDVKLDLHLTNVLCKNARRSLNECDVTLIHKCFFVISQYERRKRLVETLSICYEIGKLFDIERQFTSSLASFNFLFAIDIHNVITDKLKKYEKVSSLQLMRKRFRGGNAMITRSLKSQMLQLLVSDSSSSSCNVSISIIMQSYYKLNELHAFIAILEHSVSVCLFVRCCQCVCKHLGHANAYITRNYNVFKCNKFDLKTYRTLCKQLRCDSLMECFVDLCASVFDILHCYYKMECAFAVFARENSIHCEDMCYVRQELWKSTQNLLGVLLESSPFSLKDKIKMEDLLLALHAAQLFKKIGESFSGMQANLLQKSIEMKCKQYLDHFRKCFFESLKTNFDNEMWVVLPIRNFGIHSIREFARNNDYTSKLDNINKNEVYQSFLRGDNVFLKLKQTNANASQTNAPHSVFDENNSDACAAANDSICDTNNAINSAQPVLTSTSMALAKFVGKCLQMMEHLEPVSLDAFHAFRDCFNFYLFHVFIWFGVNVHNFFSIQESEFTSLFSNGNDDTKKREQIWQQKNIMLQAQKKYPLLTKMMNDVNELLGQRKLAPELDDLIKKSKNRNQKRPKKLPRFARCYMFANDDLDLSHSSTMQGVAARFVATETLSFLVSIIKSQHGRLMNILKENRAEITEFINSCESVVTEFKTYMYRNVPTLLVHLGAASECSQFLFDPLFSNGNDDTKKRESFSGMQANLLQKSIGMNPIWQD